MSKQERMKKLSDDELEMVSGGSTRAYLAAVDLMNGKYGTGEACRQKLADEGLDYWMIQHMANALSQGYGQTAQDVIDGEYGKDAARFKALARAGYDPILVQKIINGMLLDD